MITTVLTINLLGAIAVRFLADLKYARGRVLAQRGYMAQSVWVLEQATNLWPWEPRYYKDLARGHAVLAKVGANADDFSIYASQEADRAVQLNPQNLVTLKSVISTYYILAQIDSRYQEELEKYVTQALNLCPTDPNLWYLSALSYSLAGERSKAKLAIEQALKLKDPYPEAENLYQEL